ncbi:hypothetical protein ANN_14016 [Periplaneta americana]|uniref:Uncharacterized protein n=1 Tax=Periplaneta americana TaxID=6978 RepID=A0ABQ8SWN8_PERAM|nr:hypothetical protein ANN_14016 [Periplaneta americana]
MRLTRPTLCSPIIVTSDSKDLPGNLLNNDLKHDITSVSGIETLSAGQFLLLPQSFGKGQDITEDDFDAFLPEDCTMDKIPILIKCFDKQSCPVNNRKDATALFLGCLGITPNIYLGETFSSYICVHNDSNQIAKDVSVKADLQTSSQRIPLSGHQTESVATELHPQDTVDDVIHHEVKEVGTHILVCEVSYTSPTQTRLSFRKFFKFQVLKPLDVKTKFYNAELGSLVLSAFPAAFCFVLGISKEFVLTLTITSLGGDGISQIGDYLLYDGEEKNNHQLGTGLFVDKIIKSAVKKVEFISDRLSYLVLKGRWCDIVVINAHAPTEEKDDHIKDSFYEELEHTFDQLPRYHMKILLGDFNAKVGQEDIFKPAIGKESIHITSNVNGVRLVNFATSKNLIVKSTTFSHKGIHEYTWTSPDGLTHNQIDHILIDKRRHTSIVDIRTFRGADCNSDHYLVIGELRERLSVAKQVEQQVNVSKLNILKLKDEKTKQHYQVEISNRFVTLGSSDEVEKELDVNSVWENIRDNIKIAAEQSIGYYETKKKKPWFDEDCCIVVERRKQAKLKFLQDPVEENRDIYFNERWEASRTLRNKRRGYLKEKLNEIETNSRNKNIRDLYKGIEEFKNGYQARVNVIKDENGDLLADSHSILNRWKNYFGQLLNVHRPNRNYWDEIEIQTAEPFIPEPTRSEVEIAIENLKSASLQSDEVYLEAQVQNITTGPICLEKVSLESSHLFNVTALNTALDGESVFGHVNVLQPQASRQFLYCLAPQPSLTSDLRLLSGATNIGKLDIVWRSNLGERGRLQTSQLQRMAPDYGDIRLSVQELPNIVNLEEAFTFVCRIINTCMVTLFNKAHVQMMLPVLQDIEDCGRRYLRVTFHYPPLQML